MRTRKFPILKNFPTEREFDARLRDLGFRPATRQEVRATRKALARVDAAATPRH